MNDENLTDLLDQLKIESIPSAPENLEAKVLRNIRASRGSRSETVTFPGLLRFAVIVAIFAITIGWFIGSTQIRNGEEASKLIARNALSLEVFDSNTIHFSQTPLQR